MKTIGILGSSGFVGKILKQYYPDAIGFDIQGECEPLREVLNRDIIMVAINLKDNCISQESRDIINNYFAAIKPKSTVIIKSTFVPGTCDYFQDLHKHINLVYNPEFLTELSAWDDFTKPTFQILGATQQSLPLVHELFEILPDAPVKRVISPKDAEVLKHSFNSYYSMKVIFFNQLYDVCEQLGTDYETVREILTQDPRIGDSHSIVFHKGYRGFGGKCLPKDSLNLTKVANFPLMEKVIELNNKLTQQNV